MKKENLIEGNSGKILALDGKHELHSEQNAEEIKLTYKDTPFSIGLGEKIDIFLTNTNLSDEQKIELTSLLKSAFNDFIEETLIGQKITNIRHLNGEEIRYEKWDNYKLPISCLTLSNGAIVYPISQDSTPGVFIVRDKRVEDLELQSVILKAN